MFSLSRQRGKLGEDVTADIEFREVIVAGGNADGMISNRHEMLRCLKGVAVSIRRAPVTVFWCR
jgi:hypothetical protein